MDKLRFAGIILFTTFVLRTEKLWRMAREILRYIIPFVALAIAFIGDSSAMGTISSSTPCSAPTSELRADCIIECAGTESSLYIPRQSFASSITHIHGTAKRSNNAHKNNFEFTKAGKCFNTSIESYIQHYHLTQHPSFTKPHHRLIALGKLII